MLPCMAAAAEADAAAAPRRFRAAAAEIIMAVGARRVFKRGSVTALKHLVDWRRRTPQGPLPPPAELSAVRVDRLWLASGAASGAQPTFLENWPR